MNDDDENVDIIYFVHTTHMMHDDEENVDNVYFVHTTPDHDFFVHA